MRLTPLLLLFPLAALAQQATPHHEANFDSERAQADALFEQTRPLDALPLYEDLARQDPTMAVFQERIGAGLVAKEATLPNGSTAEQNARLQVHLAAIAAFKRAFALGDRSAYLRAAIEADQKTLTGAITNSIPISVGYTHKPNAQALALEQSAEASFGHADYAQAATLYVSAAQADAAWYEPALYAGDSYFRLNDLANATVWFKKAIALDPDRETAHRYFADALMKANQPAAAREQYILAFVAEPASPSTWTALRQYAQHTHQFLGVPAIQRPDFVVQSGQVVPDAALVASKADGRACWIAYQQYRAAHGAVSFDLGAKGNPKTLNQPIVAGSIDANGVITPSGYEHTIAEEHAALRATLADLSEKLRSGEVTEAALDPSLKNLRALEKAGFLGAWIALNAQDAGIRQDYPKYRANHRQHLFDYVSTVLLRPTQQ